LSFGHLSRIESGKLNPTKETLLKISQALKLDPRQQSYLFNTVDQPATQEEYEKVFQYVHHFVESSRHAMGISDVCGFIWYMNKEMQKLYGVDESMRQDFLRKIQGIHLLEWLYNPDTLGYKTIENESRKNLLLYQTLLFIYLINYFERKDETWLKALVERLQRFSDFVKVWNTAIKKAESNTPLSQKQLTMRFVVDGEIKGFNCNNTHINKFPRFLVSEFIPA